MPAPAVELCAVYRQRIGQAVKAAVKRGEEIVFRVEGSCDSAYVACRWDRQRRVIANGSERGMALLLPVIRQEFARQLRECEGGAVERIE